MGQSQMPKEDFKKAVEKELTGKGDGTLGSSSSSCTRARSRSSRKRSKRRLSCWEVTRGQGRDWFRLGARPAGQDAGEREAPERCCTGGAGECSDFRGDTFRAVYTVRFPNAVYVLHVFQKKSKRSIATPKHEMKLVEQRLAQVVELEKHAGKT